MLVSNLSNFRCVGRFGHNRYDFYAFITDFNTDAFSHLFGTFDNRGPGDGQGFTILNGVHRTITYAADSVFGINDTAAGGHARHGRHIMFANFDRYAHHRQRLVNAERPGGNGIFVFCLASAFRYIGYAFRRTIVSGIIRAHSNSNSTDIQNDGIDFGGIRFLPSNSDVTPRKNKF